MEQRNLYIMLSRTGTGMAKAIRACTGATYNHVSLSLDDDLHHFVSFARYAQDVALAGGYVTEPVERILASGDDIPVRIFRLNISAAQYRQLEALFAQAGNRESGLIYNSLGAMLSICRIPCRIPGAYTCLDFANAIIGRRFHSLKALEKHLAPYEIYRGDLKQIAVTSDCCTDSFFCRRGFFPGIEDTAVHFTRLLGRALRITRCRDPIAAYEAGLCPSNK